SSCVSIPLTLMFAFRTKMGKEKPFRLLDYSPSSATRQPNLVASNPADIGKPGFLMMQTKVDFGQIWQCKEATR
ncbi:hypothetical protein, partial [Thiolapillus sp.]